MPIIQQIYTSGEDTKTEKEKTVGTAWNINALMFTRTGNYIFIENIFTPIQNIYREEEKKRNCNLQIDQYMYRLCTEFTECNADSPKWTPPEIKTTVSVRRKLIFA